MEKAGIQTNKVHVRNDKLSCFKEFDIGELPQLDSIDDRRVCVPCGWFLKEYELHHIVKTINEY